MLSADYKYKNDAEDELVQATGKINLTEKVFAFLETFNKPESSPFSISFKTDLSANEPSYLIGLQSYDSFIPEFNFQDLFFKNIFPDINGYHLMIKTALKKYFKQPLYYSCASGVVEYRGNNTILLNQFEIRNIKNSESEGTDVLFNGKIPLDEGREIIKGIIRFSPRITNEFLKKNKNFARYTSADEKLKIPFELKARQKYFSILRDLKREWGVFLLP